MGLWGTVLLVAAATGCAAPDLRDFDVVDLTHAITPHIPLYPGGPPVAIEPVAALAKDGYAMNRVSMGEHTGTHVDAPSHFVAGGPAMDAVASARLVAPAVVIDVRLKIAGNPDYQVTYDDLAAWENEHGRIPDGAVVLILTGWSGRWPDRAKYLNADASGVLHFPGVGRDLALVLARSTCVGVGIDTLSVDYGPSKDFEVHRILHAKGLYHVENATNLDRLPPSGAWVMVGALKIAGGSGAPARVLALVPRS